jgi:hypothetical protein
MTDLVKRKPNPLQGGMAAMVAVMPVLANGVRVLVETDSVSVAHVATAVISVKTGVLVWAMPPSVRNEKPWIGPKCRCANWRRKPMAKH